MPFVDHLPLKDVSHVMHVVTDYCVQHFPAIKVKAPAETSLQPCEIPAWDEKSPVQWELMKLNNQNLAYAASHALDSRTRVEAAEMLEQRRRSEAKKNLFSSGLNR
ncbi:MAG: hypothetical protein WAZ18_06950 [Alphaproteobacteria bacterium]